MTAKILDLAAFRTVRTAREVARTMPVDLESATLTDDELALAASMALRAGMLSERERKVAETFLASHHAAVLPLPSFEAPAAKVAPPKYVPAYCDPANETRGAKYNRDLSTKEIAGLVRAEIKAAQKAGALDKSVKVSVRYESFSGGSAIRINVTACPVRILNVETLEAHAKAPHDFLPEYHYPRYTPEAKALLAQITSYAKAYLRDNSDIQSDYFCVNFYDGEAGFDHDLERTERLAFEAAFAAR